MAFLDGNWINHLAFVVQSFMLFVGVFVLYFALHHWVRMGAVAEIGIRIVGVVLLWHISAPVSV